MATIQERQLAERLFETAPGVWRIPLPTGLPVADVNVWYVDGPDPVLVDTGVAGPQALPLLAEALGAVGRELSGIGTVLLTHAHVDHSGAASALRSTSGCRVLAHPGATRQLADPVGALREGRAPLAGFMRRSGLSAEASEQLAAGAEHLLPLTAPCPGVGPAQEGDVLRLAGGRPFHVYETPGHSSDHLVYLLADEGLIFAGDHVLPRITANPTFEPRHGEAATRRPLVEFRASIERVSRLDARVACPGHGRPFDDVAGRCREMLGQQSRRTEQVLALLRGSGPLTRKEIGQALFGRVSAAQVYLVLSEVHAAAGLLEAEGRVRVERDGDVERVSALPA